MLKAIVIDDEPLALEVIKGLTEKVSFIELTGFFTNSFEALKFIQTNRVDLLLLDIKMPDISGIEFFRSLTNKPEVIFTTAYSEYAMDGFELRAMDYLLKPISFEKFLASCNRVRDFIEFRHTKTNKEKDYFFINAAHKLHKVFYDDILYLEGLKDYTKIHLSSSAAPLVILHSLKYFEDLLEQSEFIRIHRSYIVSIRKVLTVSRKSVLIPSCELPVSDNYRDSFFSIVEKHAK